jgi:hypothetical protein
VLQRREAYRSVVESTGLEANKFQRTCSVL